MSFLEEIKAKTQIGNQIKLKQALGWIEEQIRIAAYNGSSNWMNSLIYSNLYGSYDNYDYGDKSLVKEHCKEICKHFKNEGFDVKYKDATLSISW